jgi:Mg/Co/Ni transporter MgtE
VLDRYRELATGKDVVMYVYVTDAAGTLKGVVDMREMVAAEAGTDARRHHDGTCDRAAEGRDAAGSVRAMLFERYHFRALPITPPVRSPC